MLEPTTQVTEQFVLAGPLSSHAAVMVGAAACAMLIALAVMERKSRGWWLAGALLILRIVAVGVVLWMLRGPQITTTVRHEQPKSVIMFVDVSGSMTVTDPLDDVRMNRRWDAATSGVDTPLIAADRAVACAAVCRMRLAAFTGACNDPRRGGDAAGHAGRLHESLGTLVRQVGEAYQLADAATAPQWRRTLDTLRVELIEPFNDVRKQVDRGLFQLAPDRQDQLRSLDMAIARHVNEITRIADAVAAEQGGDALPLRMRIERVTDYLAGATWLDALRQKANVLSYRFAGDVSPLATSDWSQVRPDDDSQVTNLSDGLEQIGRDATGRPVAAALWLTDGAHNHPSDPVRVARAMGDVPSFVVPIGNTRPVRDIILHHVQGQRVAFLDDRIVIEGTVDAHGCANEQLSVQLVQNDQVIDEVAMLIVGDSFVSRFKLEQKAESLGPQSFDVRVTPLPDEKVAENNDAKVAVEVTEGTMRVFVAEGLPRWEYRYLINLFKRDPDVEYDTVLIEPRAQRRAGAPWPRTVDDWSRYRVVILGDLRASDLDATAQQQLHEFVTKRGGTLILIAGASMPRAFVGGPLGDMLPVELSAAPAHPQQAFTLEVTAEGKTMPAMQLDDADPTGARVWRELTERLPLYGLSDYAAPKPTSRVLIRATPKASDAQVHRALLCWQAVGRGKVVYLASPSTYKLRFREGDRYHHRFWAQLLRWAMAREMAGGSRTVRITTDRTNYAQGGRAQVTVYINEPDGAPFHHADAQVAASNGQAIPLVEDETSPGVYRAELPQLTAGRIDLRVEGRTIDRLLAEEELAGPISTSIVIDPPVSVELRNTLCNLPLLSQVAESTRGAVLWPTGLDAAMEQIDLDPIVSETASRRPLWNRWACLWVFAGCLVLEWTARKLAGMA